MFSAAFKPKFSSNLSARNKLFPYPKTTAVNLFLILTIIASLFEVFADRSIFLSDISSTRVFHFGCVCLLLSYNQIKTRK